MLSAVHVLYPLVSPSMCTCMQKAAELEGAVDARTVVVAKLDATDAVAGILEAADRSAAKLLPHSHADAKPAASGHTPAAQGP